MPIKLKAGFIDYINGLEITASSKTNYRAYVRWMEKYGSGVLDVAILQNPLKFDNFINELAENFDAESKQTGRQFVNNRRKSDAKTILCRHYLNFLVTNENEVAEKQEQLETEGEFQVTNQHEGKEKSFTQHRIAERPDSVQEKAFGRIPRQVCGNGNSDKGRFRSRSHYALQRRFNKSRLQRASASLRYSRLV